MGVVGEVYPADIHSFMDHLFQGFAVAGGRADGGNNFGVGSFVSHVRRIWHDKVILIEENQKISLHFNRPARKQALVFLWKGFPNRFTG
jgi:hypothetical protein